MNQVNLSLFFPLVFNIHPFIYWTIGIFEFCFEFHETTALRTLLRDGEMFTTFANLHSFMSYVI